MKKTRLFLLVAIALANLLAVQHAALAKPREPAAASAVPAATADSPPAPQPKDPGDKGDEHRDNALVSIGHDSTLAAGEHATAVVSVLGSSTSAGQVDDAVVSVLGSTRVTGPVGNAAVAVLGDTYVDSHVGNSVVAVFGDVELGPNAEVGGDVVAVGGELRRDPGAVIHGSVQNVRLFGSLAHMEWMRSWIKECLLFGRPLAFAPGLGWAWSLAFSFLAIYLLIALLFPAGVNRCVRTMEAQPGRSVLAALLTFLLKPIVFLLILVTVIGAILLPFLCFALFIAGLFGKAVALAWIGRRIIPYRDAEHPPLPLLAVLVGGIVVLLLYTVPVFGFIVYKMLGILGLGIVVYTLLLGFRASRSGDGTPGTAASAGSAAPAAPATPAGSPGAPEPAAAEASPGVATASASAAPEQTQAPAAPPAPPPAPPISIALADRAGFWHRAVALLLDLILVGIMCSIVGLHTHAVLLLLATYGAVMWKLRGTTIGGIVCNLRVVRLDGRQIDWPTAIVRALGCFLSAAVAGLGFIWVVFDPERQSWHDKIAGTVVVRTPRGTALL
ncbi:MAG TPA: RDD family protein [Steroidobacteraceae bacterium]